MHEVEIVCVDGLKKVETGFESVGGGMGEPEVHGEEEMLVDK